MVCHVAAFAGLITVVSVSRADDELRSLFNGHDLTGFTTYLERHGANNDPDGIVTVDQGMIHFYKNARDGDPVVQGYLATLEEYGDYHLRLEYRWGTKRFAPRRQLEQDAGVYYHIIPRRSGPEHCSIRSNGDA